MTKMQNCGPRGAVCAKPFRAVKGVLFVPQTPKYYKFRTLCTVIVRLSPLSPTRSKYRGPRKPAWIGLVPCVPCVPYRKTVSQDRGHDFPVDRAVFWTRWDVQRGVGTPPY